MPDAPAAPPDAAVEDGYDLWLRYRRLGTAERARLAPHAAAVVAPAQPSPTVQAALDELRRAFGGWLGAAPAASGTPVAGAIVIGTPASLPVLAGLGLPLADLGEEGYLLRRTSIAGHAVTLIAAGTDRGLLYGTFAWLRALAGGADPAAIDERSVPRIERRLLNHWDNLDRSVERGYAGESIWDWWTLPDIEEARYVDYARACASIGINGTVLNNVNARAEMLTAPWIAKAAALARWLRPYGVRVHLSVRFSAPVELGELPRADPLDPAVLAWWRRKADQLYAAIPDFGGFLVKANSEGQPGPQDYGRSHADGANMLAEALAPHGGLVMWRAFVYSNQNPADRARQAYDEFAPLDGRFAANVAVQVKNGPIDFQPREPFHPLFGAMPATPLFLEFQITKEYLGFATHLAYLGTMFEEVLAADTHVAGAGSTVARIVDGSLQGQRLSGIAGVANIGSHRTWCGSHFDAANWYAYGRLAWNPDLGARAAADEWVAQTFGHASAARAETVALMMASREAVVDYMTPLGLHHLMGSGHHHGPAPWVDDLPRADWNPTYFHRAGRDGIGFDRGPAGSRAVEQYAAPLAAAWSRPETTPPALLLWFHHLPWDHPMPDGSTLWQALVAHYDAGVAQAQSFGQRWAALRDAVDPRRHAEVAAKLAVQAREARWWRDACLAYFQSLSGLPLPAGAPPIEGTLAAFQALRFAFAPGRG